MYTLSSGCVSLPVRATTSSHRPLLLTHSKHFHCASILIVSSWHPVFLRCRARIAWRCAGEHNAPCCSACETLDVLHMACLTVLALECDAYVCVWHFRRLSSLRQTVLRRSFREAATERSSHAFWLRPFPLANRALLGSHHGSSFLQHHFSARWRARSS